MVREISIYRLRSLQDSSGKSVSKEEILHMCSGNNSLDLEKSRNIQEFCLAERITKEPRRQGSDEKRQNQNLSNCFIGFNPLTPGSLFLINGALYEKNDELPVVDPSDLDGKITCGKTVVFSNKTQFIDGSGQYKAFLDLKKLIENAALKDDENGVFLGIYVSGGYWTKQRRKFHNYKSEYEFETLKQLLQQLATNKKVVVFSDENLPDEKVNFFDWFK